MKNVIATLSLIALLALAGCASSAPSTPPADASPRAASSTPTPTETHTPERVKLSGKTIEFADLVAVADCGDLPVIRLPKVVGAVVTIVGGSDVRVEATSDYYPGISRDAAGNITASPGSFYDNLAGGGAISTHSGTIVLSSKDASFTVEIEGVDP